jgi:hypothetical protein
MTAALLLPISMIVAVSGGELLLSQVDEARASTAPTRFALEAFHSAHGRWPSDDASVPLMLDFRRPHVDSVRTLSGGRISIKYTSDSVALLRNRPLILAPYMEGDHYNWRCSQDTFVDRLVARLCHDA